jgi:hypothetical protein
MEQIFRVSDTVLLIGIARMAADPAPGEQFSNTDVLEGSNFWFKHLITPPTLQATSV